MSTQNFKLPVVTGNLSKDNLSSMSDLEPVWPSKATYYFSHMLHQMSEVKKSRRESSHQSCIELTTSRSESDMFITEPPRRGYRMIDQMMFHNTFNSIAVISGWQLTLFMSFLGFTTNRLGLQSVLPKDTPMKQPKGSSAARTKDPWITS